ncbi:MAG: PASTA domain-containing protein [Spirochaetaceae bacterium]|jgi:beta-lactam-binding protein with PASTA domain|nr:PASTA domain-containing protein [Spirochaetaceae bacterium]
MKLWITDKIDNSRFSHKVGAFFLAAFSLVALMTAIALVVFFLTVRGPEQTMVPNVVGKDIIEALLEMQQKELYPRIQLRFSQNAADKNTILEQEPRQGTIVKAGRRIRLVVSQGVQISRIENYAGRMLDEVRAELQTYVVGNETPLLSIREPIMYENSARAAGTILEQSPVAGTGISGPVTISLVVSRGKPADIVMPELLGLTVPQALAAINDAGAQVQFSIREGSSRRTAGLVVSQTPAGGVILPAGKRAEVVVGPPVKGDLAGDEVYILFSCELAPNPFPLPCTLEALAPDGSRTTLAQMNHLGGLFTYPCRVQRGTTLILLLSGAELYRQTVE